MIKHYAEVTQDGALVNKYPGEEVYYKSEGHTFEDVKTGGKFQDCKFQLTTHRIVIANNGACLVDLPLYYI
jgi:hypothetical protein